MGLKKILMPLTSPMNLLPALPGPDEKHDESRENA
jgi:hypothetical protein